MTLQDASYARICYQPNRTPAVAASLISAKENIIIPEDFVFFGEVSLSGAIRSVAKIENRLKEAQKLGFTRALAPSMAKQPAVTDIQVSQMADLGSFVEEHFSAQKQLHVGDA